MVAAKDFAEPSSTAAALPDQPSSADSSDSRPFLLTEVYSTVVALTLHLLSGDTAPRSHPEHHARCPLNQVHSIYLRPTGPVSEYTTAAHLHA